MEGVVEKLGEVARFLEESVKEKKVPEQARFHVERLARTLRETLQVLEVLGRGNTVQTRISPSARSAMFHLRRAVYATIGELSRSKGVDREMSVEEWRRVARRLVEELNKAGVVEAPTKIVLAYELAEKNGVKYLRFTRADVLYFELEGTMVVDLR